jgi:hypothetical protein
MIVDKFRRLAGKALPPAAVERLKDSVLQLDDLTDASDLARLLTPSA